MYGSSTMSALELAHGYTRPIQSKVSPSAVPSEIEETHGTIDAKRRLTRILRFKDTRAPPPISVNDICEIY